MKNICDVEENILLGKAEGVATAWSCREKAHTEANMYSIGWCAGRLAVLKQYPLIRGVKIDTLEKHQRPEIQPALH